jgi:hypothetical protein
MKWKLFVRLALKWDMIDPLFKRVRKRYNQTRLGRPERLKYLITSFTNKMPGIASL